MKRMMLLVMVAGTAFTSCSKCTVCTPQQGTDAKVCEQDYPSNSDYEAAIDFYEGAGYNCYKSL